MQIDGLIPFGSSTEHAMASSCFLKIFITFCSFSTVKSTAIITSLDFSSSINTYFKCFYISFKTRHSKLFSSTWNFSSLFRFSVFLSFMLKTVSAIIYFFSKSSI